MIGIKAYLQPRRLDLYGKLRVQGYLPNFGGFAPDGTEDGAKLPPGRFHIHFLGLDHPDCLDLQCTPRAADILRLGGHVHVEDVKVTENLGVPSIHDRVRYRSADSLMVVADDQAQILAIFRDANLRDLDLALAVIEGRPRGLIENVQMALSRLR